MTVMAALAKLMHHAGMYKPLVLFALGCESFGK
jgi:hypothetical protein